MTALPRKVGILGGGQLARMMALSAHQLGVRPFVFADKPTDCATHVCADVRFSDKSVHSLREFLSLVDVVTVENEFIDLAILSEALAGARTPSGKAVALYPSVAALKAVQNKFHQKLSLKKARIPSLDFIEIKNREEFRAAQQRFTKGLVVKSATMGYDGKGTFIFPKSKAGDPGFADTFFTAMPGFSGYAEPLAAFKKELAVVVARSARGETRAFPLVETNQDGGICRWALAPARVTKNTAARAVSIGTKVIKTFGGVGVFGVEMFLLGNGEVVVNEIAPRVHNSGHLTMDGCFVGQFEQHLRAVLGLPLLKTDLVANGAAMANIIGADDAGAVGPDGVELAGKNLESDCWLHWYGKTGSAQKRKLGHVNAVAGSPGAALKKALAVRNRINI